METLTCQKSIMIVTVKHKEVTKRVFSMLVHVRLEAVGSAHGLITCIMAAMHQCVHLPVPQTDVP